MSVEPYIVRRTVAWGDCDPAATIFMPRIVDFAVEASEQWYRETTGHTWLDLRRARGIGSPVVSTSVEMTAPLTCGEEVAMAVQIKRLGRSSTTYAVTGRRADGTPCFKVEIVQVKVALDVYKSCPIPDDIRAPLARYFAACPAA